jgi:hypothetical protein
LRQSHPAPVRGRGLDPAQFPGPFAWAMGLLPCARDERTKTCWQ